MSPQLDKIGELACGSIMEFLTSASLLMISTHLQGCACECVTLQDKRNFIDGINFW